MGLTTCNVCNKEMADIAKTCPHCGAPNKIIKDKNKTLYTTVGIVAIILITIVCVITFNKNSKPKGMSKEVFNLGISALKITDEFLDGKITSDEIDSSLENIQKQLDNIEDTDAVIMSSTIFNLNTDIFLLDGFASGGYDDVLESRNDLANELNQEKR